MKIFLMFCLMSSNVFSQKNILWIGHSITKNNQDNVSFKSPTFSKIVTFGVGISIINERIIKSSKTSSFLFGVEVSSVRQGFYLNNFSNYMTNTSLKIPLLYGFKFPVSKKVSTLLQIGVNLQLQLNSSTTTFIWNNSTMLNIISHSGVFPLVHINLGFEKQFRKKQLNIMLGINKGFIDFEEITYTNTPGSIVTKSLFNGSYYELKLNWMLFSK